MSNLSQFFGASQKRIEEDPMNQIAFAVYTQGYYSMATIGLYNHKLEMIGKEQYQGTTRGDFVHASWDEYAGSDYTQQLTVATSAVTTGAQYPEQSGGSAAHFNGPLGHAQFKVPTRNTGGDIMIGTFPHREGYKNCLVGSSFGLDQGYTLFTRRPDLMDSSPEAGFYIRKPVPSTAIQIWQDNANGDISGSNTTINGDMDFMGNNATANRVNLYATGMTTNTYRVATGGICYNQRTKTLCLLERPNNNNNNSGNRWRPVICKNAPDPLLYIGKERQYQVALTAAVAVSGNKIVGGEIPADGYEWGEAGQFARPILCDNNTIYYHAEPSNTNPAVETMHKWTMNAGGTAFNTCVVHAKADSWGVPSYSDFDTTWQGKVEYQQSLDGEFVCSYSCPHHYSGGLRMVLINLKTGKTTKMHTAQDTANSWSVCAYGASNFIIKRNENTDGQGGGNFFKLNWDSYDRYFGGSGDYSGTENALMISWTYGDFMDGPYYSTSHGGLWRNIEYDNRAIVLAEKNQFNVYNAQS